jgi:predicted secreted hydrolase
MIPEIKPVKFPEDESAHECIVEWWYFNGHLKDSVGREYSFMDCLFKVDLKRVKAPFWSWLPLKLLYFSHSLLSDLSRVSFQHRITPFSLISEDSFTKPLLFANYINPEIGTGYVNCVIEKTAESTYHLKNEDADLTLVSTKPPLLEGGAGYVDLGPRSSYYYSLTNLKTSGRIKVGDEWVEVTGKSWMDHQWSQASYAKTHWDWFSIQLDDNTEMICCSYFDDLTRLNFADVSYPDGTQEHLKDVEILPGERQWHSPKSQANYPLSWRVRVPSKGVDLNLETRMENQEMLFGAVNYWEGPLRVEGSFGGQPVQGVGFMELVGYPSKYGTVDYIGDEIGRTGRKVAAAAKKKVTKFTDDFKKSLKSKK